MPDGVTRYPRYRFPPSIISHAVWLYYRFTLSFRDVEDLLFLAVHDVVRNLFSVGRHQLRAAQQRLLRSRAFGTWDAVAAA